MTARPAMILPYIVDARVGDGYRPAFVLETRADAVLLFVPSKLATVTVPQAVVARASVLSYQPRSVRERLLAQVRLHRQQGRRFPRKAAVEMLRRLGAAKAAIDETVTVAPLPAVLAERRRRTEEAARAADLAAVATAIREKIEFQLAEPAVMARPPVKRPRARSVHPDQLVLAL